MPLSLLQADGLVGSLPIGDMEVIDAQFEIYDYDGKVDFAGDDRKPPTCLRLDLKLLADGADHCEHLSAGSSANTTPSTDFQTLEAQHEGVKGVYLNTKLMQFMGTLQAKGYPPSALSNFTAKSIIGLQFTADRPVAPDSGIKRSEKQEKYGPPTFFGCKEIIRLPPGLAKAAKAGAGGVTAVAGAAATTKPTGATAKIAAAKAAAAAKAQPVAAPVPEPEELTDANPEVSSRAVDLIVDIITNAKDNMLSLNGVKVKVFSALKTEDKAVKDEILALVMDTGWLTSNGFAVTDGIVSFA